MDPDPNPYWYLVPTDPEAYIVITDPDPGGPKTYGSDSGSATLQTMHKPEELNILS